MCTFSLKKKGEAVLIIHDYSNEVEIHNYL